MTSSSLRDFTHFFSILIVALLCMCYMNKVNDMYRYLIGTGAITLPFVVQNTSEWPERERSTESDAFVSDGSKFQDQRVPQLVQQILKQVSTAYIINLLN